MPDLNFRIASAGPRRLAAEPTILFGLHVSEAVPPGREPIPILGVALRCRLSIEPARRRYSEAERGRLVDLFCESERWGQTLRPILWAQVGVILPAFDGEVSAELAVPCGFDFSL